MEKIDVSVIIPVYNAQSTIAACLESVFRQTYLGNIEIIVVNDGSTDNSQIIINELIRQNPLNKITLLNQSNGGVSKARNVGLKAAKGSWIAFLDSDDRWQDNKMKTQLDVCMKDKKIMLIGTTFNSIKYRWFFFKKFNFITTITLKTLLFKNFFQPSTVMMKREVLSDIGYFDENQRYAEEGNYFFRISHKYKCVLINESYLKYDNSMRGDGHRRLSQNLKEMEKGELKNLKFAYTNGYINLSLYVVAVIYSITKYLKRIFIYKIRGFYADNS